MLEGLYYLAVVLLLFSKGIGLYDGTVAFKLFLLPALVLLCGKIFLTKYNKKEILVIGAFLGVGALSYLLTGEKGLLLYILLLVGMKGVPVKRVFQTSLLVWSISFFGITLSSLLHLYDTPFKVHDKLGMGHIFRWGLGYVHPNILHVSFFVLIILLGYLIKERFDFKVCLLLFAANCYVFLYSVSYAGFGMVSIYLIMQLYFKYRGKVGILEKIFAYAVFPMASALSLIGPLVLEGKAYEIINKLLNNRLILAENFLKPENLTPFGFRVADLVTANLTMDNAYVFAFITYGYVVFAGIFIGYELLMHQLLKRNMGTEAILTIAILGYGLVEPFLFNTSLKNVSVFLLGAALFGELELKAEENWLLTKCLSPVADRIRQGISGKKVRILVCGILAGLIVAAAYGMASKVPQAYMVQRADCEVEGKDFKTFTEEYVQNHPEIRVLDYVDKDTFMEVFSGNIVKLEQVRGILSAFLLGAAGLIVLLCGYYSIRKNRG